MEAAFVDIGKGRNGVLVRRRGQLGRRRTRGQVTRDRGRAEVRRQRPGAGDQGPDRPQGRSADQPDLAARPLPRLRAAGRHDRHQPQAARHRTAPAQGDPEEGRARGRRSNHPHRRRGRQRGGPHPRRRAATGPGTTIEKTAAKAKAAPILVHGEPDLAVRVVRDVFNEDFTQARRAGRRRVEDDLATTSTAWHRTSPSGCRSTSATGDLFHDLRVDEQLMKALDRKVWLPSGGSLVIDRTEAMTVIDVNTGKFVGSGGNLEQTVTRNNLEAAEEIVRQLRLRDVGGIVVIDFIDMVLESNRELVLRRLTECLGRDRTKHQVAEVTSLGLVQMTRKRVGEGLLEAFSEPCTVCHGRGVILHTEPVERAGAPAGDERGGESAGQAPRAVHEGRARAGRATDHRGAAARPGSPRSTRSIGRRTATSRRRSRWTRPAGQRPSWKPPSGVRPRRSLAAEPRGARASDSRAGVRRRSGSTTPRRSWSSTAVASARTPCRPTRAADAEPAVAEPVDPARVDAEPVERKRNRPEVLTPRARPRVDGVGRLPGLPGHRSRHRGDPPGRVRRRRRSRRRGNGVLGRPRAGGARRLDTAGRSAPRKVCAASSAVRSPRTRSGWTRSTARSSR